MMKKTIIFMVAAVVVMLQSCTQNNGNIGQWFGHWKVNAITVDGVADSDYEGNVFFSFQSKVFGQRLIDDYHGYEPRFANWDDRGDYFIITFPYETDADGNPLYDDDGNLVCLYEPLEVTRMSMGENVVHVDSKEGNNVQLSMTAADGSAIVYSLEKW